MINPASGRGISPVPTSLDNCVVSGQAEKLFKKVEPFFVNANIEVTKVLTQRAGHATEFATTLDRSKYDAAITVGGDGIAYECTTVLAFDEVTSTSCIVIQGLMKRPDWANAIQTPFSVKFLKDMNLLTTE